MTLQSVFNSLVTLAAGKTDNEKKLVKKECEKFTRNYPSLNFRFNLCTKDEQYWVPNYFSGGKGKIPYEIITSFDSLNITPENDKFFRKYQFNSDLKDDTINLILTLKMTQSVTKNMKISRNFTCSWKWKI